MMLSYRVVGRDQNGQPVIASHGMSLRRARHARVMLRWDRRLTDIRIERESRTATPNLAVSGGGAAVDARWSPDSHPWPEIRPMNKFDHRVLSYVAGLEVTLDRLRQQWRTLHGESVAVSERIERHLDQAQAGAVTALGDIRHETRVFRELLGDLTELHDEGYSTPDRAVRFDARSLVERVFRRHKRLQGATAVELILELPTSHIVWFPERLAHILESLFANALRQFDPTKGQARIHVAIRSTDLGYELRVTDNGLGLTRAAQARLFDLFDRTDPARLADPVVGLAVLKLLIEQSGGTLSVESTVGQGASFVALLPKYAEKDFLT